MANNDYLVNKYYKKLYEFAAKLYSYRNIVRYNETHIKELLDEIVSNNLDYLLTDSILDYSVFNGKISSDLYQIVNNQNSQIDFLTGYFRHVLKDYRDFGGLGCQYSKLLDDDLKKAVINVLKRFDKLSNSFDFFNYRSVDLQKIIYIVLSYYVINNRQDNIDELYDILFSDPYQILDSLYMNSIKDQISDFPIEYDDNLYKFVLSRIKTKNTKVIK